MLRDPAACLLFTRAEKGQLALEARVRRGAGTRDKLAHDDLEDGRLERVALRHVLDLVGLERDEAHELGAEARHAEVSEQSLFKLT